MFAGLEHWPVVGRYHQQGKVDARGSGQHVPHEPFVAGNIYNPQDMVSERQPGEPQVDRDASGLFGWQSVAICAG